MALRPCFLAVVVVAAVVAAAVVAAAVVAAADGTRPDFSEVAIVAAVAAAAVAGNTPSMNRIHRLDHHHCSPMRTAVLQLQRLQESQLE